MKRRILHVNLNNSGGAFSVIYQVGNELAEEYVFDYFATNHFILNEVYQEMIKIGCRTIESIISGNKLLKQIRQQKAFFYYLKTNTYSIVHIHADTAWKMYMYTSAAKKAGVRNIIAHSHSSGINGHYRILNYLCHKLCVTSVLRSANVLCACSMKAAKWMFVSKALSANILTNGLNINRYMFSLEQRALNRNKYNVKEGDILIGTAGDFSWTKNALFLLKVFKELSNNDKYKLIFIGDGNGRKEAEKYVSKQKLHKKVIFTGRITNVNDVMNAIDIFVLPSRFEGMPMSALEAQANGAYTILSSRIGKEVECSNKCEFIDINDPHKWAIAIRQVNIDFDRYKCSEYIDFEKIDIKYTAEHFKRLYKSLDE